jgi:hypothetical protein
MTSLKRSTIFVLLRPSRPAAISRFVVSVIIDTVKRETGRFLTHVSQKIFKAVTPSVAHCNAAPTVVFELFDFRIVASRFHFRPRSKRSAPPADCVSVCDAGFTNAFKHETSARLRIATAEIATACSSFVAASATAFPVYNTDARRSSLPVRNAENGQAAKYLACDIVKFGHRSASSGSRSSGGQTRQGLAVAISATRTL